MPRALIFCSQRRSMVSSIPITTAASALEESVDQQTQQPACDGAGRPYSLVEHTMIDWEIGLLLPPENTQCRGDGSLARRQDGASHQQQNILPGRAGKQLGQESASRNSRRSGRGTCRMAARDRGVASYA